MNKTFDVIVVGLGAMGSATLYQLSKRGATVLGIDQFNPPHNMGSSHGESRIIRQVNGEGTDYFPLVERAYEIWTNSKKKVVRHCSIILEDSSSAPKMEAHNFTVKQTLSQAQQPLQNNME